MTVIDRLDEFRRNGFIVIHDAVDKKQCTRARQLIWNTIPESQYQPAEWVGKGSEFLLSDSDNTGIKLSKTDPFEKLLKQSYSYANDLVGGKGLAPPTWQPQFPCFHAGQTESIAETDSLDHGGIFEPVLRYPEETDKWRNPFPHIDGDVGDYNFSDTDYLPFTIGLTLYFNRVEPRGGGFTVWPGSHKKIKGYFTDKSYSDYLDNPQDITSLEIGCPLEITGPPGTLVLWHPALAHTAGPNIGPKIRMAGIQRLSKKGIQKSGESNLSNIWSQYDTINS